MTRLSWLRSAARAAALAPILLALICGLAVAANVSAEVAQLGASIDARLNLASGKEAKKLKSVLKRIDRAGSPVSVTDQAKILVGVHGSRTADETVLAEAEDLINCLVDAVVTQRITAEAFLEGLSGSFAAKLERALAKAAKRRDKGLELIETNPGKAANLLRKAYDAYVKAARTGQKLDLRQQAANSVGVPSKFQVVARLTGDGVDENFKGSSLFSVEFNTGLLQGCTSTEESDVCTKTVNMSFFYPDGSTETGPRSAFFIAFEDFENSRYFESFGAALTITKSTGSVIEGTFSATIESFDEPPRTVRIEGAFRARRR